MTAALAALETRIARDLAILAHPAQPWASAKTGPDGSPALDVLVVGAGQSGLAVAFGLKRWAVTRVLAVDAAPFGREGPWTTYARMPTLRSPKNLTGPDLDIPSLSYQAWHEAKYGEAHWNALGRIAREDWNDYLLFFRRVTALDVRNETTVTDIAPAGELLAATLEHGGTSRVVHARKIVLCTGQEGTGGWWTPPMLAALPKPLWAHTAEAIDFSTLAGKRVAVIGAGASAFDNAATALEAGAADVTLFCRRPEIQTVQPYRWLTFRGFLAHLRDLDDAWRWRFMARILGMREGFPQDTYDRCARHANFTLRTGAPWAGARAVGERVVAETAEGPMAFDFVIAGTGIAMDYGARPELARFSGAIARWADRYESPPEERDERLAQFPYLAEDYSFVERAPGEAPWIANIHLFTIASTMSFGPSGSSINAMTTAVPALVRGVTRGLFRADVDDHWAALAAYDERQAEVSNARPMAPRAAAE